MPNHISNRLTIHGTQEQVAAITAAVCSLAADGDELLIDFNRIVPMPEVLKNTGSGFNTIDGKRVESWWSDGSLPFGHPDRKPDRLFTDEEQAALAAAGARNWYDWSIANWGTKWNAYQQSRQGENAISFQTAWSPPLPVLAALAALFPQTRFVLEYADEDIGSNSGIVVFESGELHSGTSLAHEAAAKLWFELNELDPRDRGYDPDTFEYVDSAELAV